MAHFLAIQKKQKKNKMVCDIDRWKRDALITQRVTILNLWKRVSSRVLGAAI